MSSQEMLSQREKATRALGAAMLAAIEMTVREYMKPGQEEGYPPLPFAAETADAWDSAEMNENFDLARFYRLRGVEDGERTVQKTQSYVGETAHGGAAEDIRTEKRRSTEEFAAPTVGAEEISQRFERDARRYDAPFRVYE